jgi:hypothetical protein
MKKDKLPVLILAIILGIALVYNIISTISDFSNCSNVCGKYKNDFNTSGCFCKDAVHNISTKPMWNR